MRVLLVNLLFLSPLWAYAQTDTTASSDHGGYDTLKVTMLPEVTITALPDLGNYQDRRDYYILRRKVLKVWPYAKEAAEQYFTVEQYLQEENRNRKRKKYAKQVQKYMSENFKDTLKTLTRSEGVVLVKLVNRETGRTTHEIIKEYRGGMSAVFWQSLAKIYDNDLKSEFSPATNKDDAWIENILNRGFEAGIIQPVESPIGSAYSP